MCYYFDRNIYASVYEIQYSEVLTRLIGTYSFSRNQRTSKPRTYIGGKRSQRRRTMVQGEPLIESEKSVILALHGEGNTITTISCSVNRCRRAVREVITDVNQLHGTHKRGAKKKAMTRALRLILRHARSGSYTVRQLRDRFTPFVTVRRIQQLLAEDPLPNLEMCSSCSSARPSS